MTYANEEVFLDYQAKVHEEKQAEIDELQATADQIEHERHELERERNALLADLDDLTQARQADEDLLRAELDEQESKYSLAINEATQAVAKANDDRFTELLIFAGIGGASMIAGVYLQRKFDIRIPWIFGVGMIAAIAGYRKRQTWNANTTRVLIGVGGGLILGTGVVFFIDALPDMKKS